MKKAAAHSIDVVDDVVCIAVTADDQSQVAIPIEAFSRMNADALRFLHARSLLPSNLRQAGGHLQVKLGPADNFEVATIPTETGDAIALLVDKETQKEIGFLIQPKAAKELGEALIQKAGLANPRPASSH